MLGPSGSGKTTVLRMIAGFEEPTAGRVFLGGDDVTRRPPFERDVNTVFQDYALFPHMDVLGNVEYGLRVKKVPRGERRERALAALDTVRLSGYGDRRPTQLSGGQRQRVALARALVNRPKVLLLDEPLGALDLKLRREMQIELKQIQREVGITFCFVTHDQEEALTMSDRIAVFNDGRIEQVATPAELYEAPADVVRRRLRRHLQPAHRRRRQGGRSAATGTFSIRPEKIQLRTERRSAGPGQGGRRRATIVYLGSVNHYLVDLDGGSTLTVLRQNLHGTSRPGDSAAAANASTSPGPTSTSSISRRHPADRSPARRRRTTMRITRLTRAGVAVAVLASWPPRLRHQPRGTTSGDDGATGGRGAGRLHRARPADGRGARRRRGRAQRPGLAGLRRGRLHRQERRLGDAVRGGDRLRRQREVLRHLRRGRHPDEVRRVRRGVGLRRRVAAADRRRRRRAGQHRPDPQLRRRLAASSRTASGTPSTARCTASRTATAPTC